MLAFVLTMPNKGSWNGKWSGEDRLYAKCISVGSKKEKELAGKNFYYRWDDGWGANIEVKKVTSNEAQKIRRKSVGFYGYDWMVDSIIRKGEIKYDRA